MRAKISLPIASYPYVRFNEIRFKGLGRLVPLSQLAPPAVYYAII